jgi:transposase
MRQVREVLRLRTAGVGLNEIARRVGVAPSTVRLTLKRLATAGLSWPLPAEMTDSALETALFAAAGTKQGHRRYVEPDWAEIHRELKRKHVTLTMLWDEYIERCPEGYRYSRFCELYRGWASRLSVTMRQAHIGGDKLFVDYAGDTVPVIIDRLTGQVRPAQIFVAVMGASNFTYAEASWTQALADWIGAHTRAFAALGGVPKLLVPDNTKVAVIKACLYEPQVNRTYAEMAAHYDTAILPARPRRPRDKAKVEVAVLIIERWLLGRLRHRRFYSLAELNTAIGELLRQLNDERLIRRLGVTRRALFEELDQPNLNSLPSQPYCFAEWRVRRVGVDYHTWNSPRPGEKAGNDRGNAGGLGRDQPPDRRGAAHNRCTEITAVESRRSDRIDPGPAPRDETADRQFGDLAIPVNPGGVDGTAVLWLWTARSPQCRGGFHARNRRAVGGECNLPDPRAECPLQRNAPPARNPYSSGDRRSWQIAKAAQRWPCCGGRMIIVETFERDGAPRGPPSRNAGVGAAMS